MKNLKTIFSNKKEIIITLFIIVFLFLSIKPFLFTINYFIGNYYIKIKGESSEKYVLRAIKYNPESYRYFGSGNRIENLVKSAILYKNISVYNTLDKNTRKKIELKYKDNFYFQNILNNLDKKREWQHLDQMSYSFLREKRYNGLTISILDKLNPEFDKKFLNNILDFLKWQDNIELFKYISVKYNISDHSDIRPEFGIDYYNSIDKLKTVVCAEFNMEKDKISKNLLDWSDVEKQDSFKGEWLFYNWSEPPLFGQSSFFVEKEKVNNNNMTRSFNPYIDNSVGKSIARAGLWYKRWVKIKKGYYIFSFDYWTKTGREDLRFWLGKGTNVIRLIDTKNRWQKVVYIFDNTKGGVKSLRPLIRMYGTGSLWFDNVFLGKLAVKELSQEDKNLCRHYFIY